ncbi:hypothetical protein Nepgr_032679 [Nepenthes gracilis]|uniref:K Homology domain-containing protein n=1 Tax=Nepenthes gracilis TaxID=150966 RepID=A0AAD3TKI9_NEPGR|nr:hypothetical protein Nepgr_032679 [Nepenthes gracilis]
MAGSSGVLISPPITQNPISSNLASSTRPPSTAFGKSPITLFSQFSLPTGTHSSVPSLPPLVAPLSASSLSPPPFLIFSLLPVDSSDPFPSLIRDGRVHTPVPDASFLKVTSGSVPHSPATFNAGPASEFLLVDKSKQEDATILIASYLPYLGLTTLPANPPTAPYPSLAVNVPSSSWTDTYKQDFGGPPSRLGNIVPLRELANVRQSHTKKSASMKGHSNSFAILQSVNTIEPSVLAEVGSLKQPKSQRRQKSTSKNPKGDRVFLVKPLLPLRCLAYTNMEEEIVDEHDAGVISADSDSLHLQAIENNSVEDGEKRWPGWPGDNVFRILVPAQKVGSIIGRKGEYIKKMCEETKARIKILDGPPGTLERAVMISAKEEPDSPMPPAIDGLLRVHKRIINADGELSQASSGQTVITRLLVASTQAGSLIGKQGATVKSIQDASNCNIRVLGGEHLPLFALQDDSVVEIQGESTSVNKAVELIASQLRKFLVDHGVVAVFEKQMQSPNIRANQNLPPPEPWGPPQAFSVNAGGGAGFGPNPQYMQPRHSFDHYYPPTDFHPEKQPRQAPPMYGRDAPIGISPSSTQPQQSMVTKVTQHMQIPLSYADAVIGASGANISYMRRASGATITIQEARGVPGEMTVEISGSASQIQAAQQLIQNAMAEAASNAQNAATGSFSQGYGSYPPPGQVYASPSSNPTGQLNHAPAADYGSVYGAHYGY